MNNSYAKVILDSISPGGRRLITVETRYWRMIHSEVLTHRDRARNSASSRAIPFIRYQKGTDNKIENCTYSKIENDPFMPEFIGTEQKGMQSGSELSGVERVEAIKIINDMRQYCLDRCLDLFNLGVHKSIINRYVEPWSYITVIMTATEWNNFFRLRIHPKAEKHFNKVAKQIKEAIDQSKPQELKVGQWHTPYIRPDDWFDSRIEHHKILERILRLSAARCARLSYLTHDGIHDPEADIRIFNSLIHPKNDDGSNDTTIHASPLEHIGQCHHDANYRSGPFFGWHQFRKNFPNENVEG